jgi:hypothetical protein
MVRDALKRSAALWSREAIRREPGRADRRRGPSAGSRWRCRAGPWECRRRGFSSGAPEIGHRVGNGGRRWRRRSPTCPPTIAGRTGRRDRRGPARHELAGIEESTVATLMAEAGVVARRKRRRRGTATPDKSARKSPDGLRRDFTPDAAAGRALCGVHRNPHRRRQTPLATVLDLYSRRSYRYPTLDRALCPAHASVDPSAGHPPSVSEFGGQRGGADRRRCPVWRPLRFWPMGARRVGVSVSWGVLRNTRRNLPI